MAGLVIRRLALSHFRSHVATRIDLDGRSLAIIGHNGAGKTNILEAASLLSPGRGLRRALAEELARRPDAIGWKVSAELDGFRTSHLVETWAEGASGRQVRIDGKLATQAELGRICRILWLVPAMDRLWTETPEGRRRFLDRIALSFAPDHGDLTLTYERAMRERNRLLKEGSGDRSWFSALEARMAGAATQIVANRDLALVRLAAAQAQARTAFPKADLALVEADGAPAIEALAEAFAHARGRDMAAGRTLFGPHRTDMMAVYAEKGVPAERCSTGEQKAMLISLILANARALAQDLGTAPILLLDEVAAHLDAARRDALYDEIAALGAQALMTGTDAALFDSLGDRVQKLTLREDAGRTGIVA